MKYSRPTCILIAAFVAFMNIKPFGSPKDGEELDCSREIDNNDPYAVNIMKGKVVTFLVRYPGCVPLI